MTLAVALAVIAGLATAGPAAATATGVQPRKWFNSFAGPYIIVVTRCYMCEEVADRNPPIAIRMLVSHWLATRPLELQRATANISMKMDFTDDLWVLVNVDKRNNNQWKPNAFVLNFPKGGCSIMRKLFPDVMRMVFGDQETPACLFPKGEYSVWNKSVDWSVPDVPILPYAEYRLHVRVGLAETLATRTPLSCFQLEGFAHPRIQQ